MRNNRRTREAGKGGGGGGRMGRGGASYLAKPPLNPGNDAGPCKG